MTTVFVTKPDTTGEMPMRPDTQVDVALDRLRNRLTRKHISLDLLETLLIAVEAVAFGIECDQIIEQRDESSPYRAQAISEVWRIRARVFDDLKPRVWDAQALIRKAESS